MAFEYIQKINNQKPNNNRIILGYDNKIIFYNIDSPEVFVEKPIGNRKKN